MPEGEAVHTTAARQSCHIPVVTNGAGIAQPAAVAALCANVLALAAWRTWAASPGIVALSVQPPAELEAPGSFGTLIGVFVHSMVAVYRMSVFGVEPGAPAAHLGV